MLIRTLPAQETAPTSGRTEIGANARPTGKDPLMSHSTMPDRGTDALTRVIPLLVEQFLREYGAFDGFLAVVGDEIELTWPNDSPRQVELTYRFSGVRDGDVAIHGYSTLTIPLRGA